MSLYDIQVTTIQGEPQFLSDYAGMVLLIVNTASRCGFTPQYQGLQKLYEQYQKQRFAVLGFPCNQFMRQEPGNEEEISQFCQMNYGVTFPLFAKVDVIGANAHPLFQYLTEEAPGIFGSKTIKWNFTKFLVDRNGKVVKRFAPTETPEQIEPSIQDLL